jgi:hypothetical protein
MAALGDPLGAAFTRAIQGDQLQPAWSRRGQGNCRGLVGKFWNVWRPDFGLLAINSPAEFLACNPPRTAKLVIGFSAEPIGQATRLTTETRVYCPDRYSLIMFTPYWLVIRPVSGLLRRRALGAIRRIAEHRAGRPDAPQTA